MATHMDKSLDEILGEQKPRHNNNNINNDRRRTDSSNRSTNSNNNNNNNNKRRDNNDYPRDGVKKGYYRDDHRDLDSEWVHDRYEDNTRRGHDRRRRDSPEQVAFSDVRGTRIRVDNIHYDLTEEELKGLFSRMGSIVRFNLRYDRAGRSEGVAFVTYKSHSDAKRAVTEFNGANANGQPISLTIVAGEASSCKRNPFDTAVMPGRSLADRVTNPRDRSKSPRRHIEDEDVGSLGIDRYIPGQKSNRSRSPMSQRRHQTGRRPGDRRQNNRDNNSRGGQRGARDGSTNSRPRKTQEELDAEIADYFGGSDEKPTETALAAAFGVVDDVDMIE